LGFDFHGVMLEVKVLDLDIVDINSLRKGLKGELASSGK